MDRENIFTKFPKTFWTANVIELLERWAWYGFFMLFANYLTGSYDDGGLQFSQEQKGIIMGVGTGILYFLPIITGSIADKYGYKKVLILSFLIYVSAFIMLPLFDTFTGVFLMYLYLAIGAALFKPVVSATIAKTTNDKNSSIGFGIFYMMVNIGAFIGPLLSLMYNDSSFKSVFYISAGIISLNFILLFFYKEPEREVSAEPLKESISRVFKNIILVFKDLKFIVFLLIVAGFWTMYNQLFFTLPVFISQWVDTAPLYSLFAKYIPFVSDNYGTPDGQLKAAFITNFDALFIILFQILVSSIIMKLKPLHSMIAGFLVCSIGMALTLVTQNVAFTIVAIFIFSIGEMAGSPKITEYIGKISPPDKKALYMGYSFIPVFIGNVFAGIISGNVYQLMSDKTQLIKNLAVNKGFEISGNLSNNEYAEKVAEKMGMSSQEFTNYLWDTFHPGRIWIILLSIGLLSVVALFIYDKVLKRV